MSRRQAKARRGWTRRSMAATLADSRGFTMLELLVVIAVIALVVGLGAPLLPGSQSTVALKDSTRSIAAALRLARSHAIRTNAETTLTLDLESGTFATPDGRVVGIPRGIELELHTAQSELAGNGVGGIRFFADGSSTGGRIRLKRTTDQRYGAEVRIDWMTGRVAIVQ